MHVIISVPLTSSVDAFGNTAFESDTIQYTCNLTFNGSGEIIPSIRWTSGGVTITGGVVPTRSANSIVSVYTVTAGRANLPSFQCEVFFPATTVNGTRAVTATNAQNTPTYTDSASFAEITVTCKLFLSSFVAFYVICTLKLLLVYNTIYKNNSKCMVNTCQFKMKCKIRKYYFDNILSRTLIYRLSIIDENPDTPLLLQKSLCVLCYAAFLF